MSMKSVNCNKFWKKGYTIVRDVFTPEELDELRALVLSGYNHDKKAKVSQVDALANPNLAKYVYEKRLIDVAKQILGTSEVFYFGDASYAVVGDDYKPGVHVGGWHRDNTDRKANPEAPDWQGDYGLIRFGIYLQDHSKYSGGLLIREESHRKFKTNSSPLGLLKERYLNTSLGDVGVWSMRITHAGVGRCYKILNSYGISPHVISKIPQFMVAPQQDIERAALWISYGKAGIHLDRHCEYLLGRSERKRMWENSFYSEETLQRCKENGLSIINMPERMRKEIAKGNNVGTHDNHYQLSY